MPTPLLALEMSLIRANDLDFHVEDRGSGTPIVLLHGFTGSSASWSSISDDFATGNRVITIDVIGHGASSVPTNPARYTFEHALADLAEVADTLGLARSTWLGYSMGGRLALGFALRHPGRVSSLILESATPGIQDEVERSQRGAADEALARRIEDIGVEAFVDEWERLPMWESQHALPNQVLQHQRELRLGNTTTGLANSLRGMGQGAQLSHWDRLGEIPAPVLLIAGGLDRKFVGIAVQMGVRMPDATLAVVPDTGHAVHLERPQQFTAEVRDFLARRERLGTSETQESALWT